MEIGQGGTNEWYAGGISLTNGLCLIISHSDVENKQKVSIVIGRTVSFRLSLLLNIQITSSGPEYQRSTLTI